MTGVLFPFSDSLGLYLGFLGLVLALLAVDLGVFNRRPHAVSLKEAGIWTVVWVSLALLFNFGLWQYAQWSFAADPQLMSLPGFDPMVAARQVGLEFLTGYLIEKSLAVDNLFVFIIVFQYFAIPAVYQHRVLFYGILGALVFRAIFIAMGAALMQYAWVAVVFGVFLIFTGGKLLFGAEKVPDPEKNFALRLVRRWLPVTPTLEGAHFFVRKNGVAYVTPLFMALLFLEMTDIVFAVDSVPAIFAITKEPFIVFTSNIFAILGLRSMFFLLAGVMHKFHYLKYGLGIILVFVGLKMAWLNEHFGGKFPIMWSLGIIGGVLVGSVLLSLLRKPLEVSQENQ